MLKHFENPYITEFETEVLNCVQKEENWVVTLKDSYFYPTGGGQDCDEGTIDGIEVIEVFKDEQQNAFHVVKDKIENKSVKCVINSERRLANMQQHSGQHLLSMCFYEKLNLPTTSVRIYADKPSYVDIASKTISENELKRIEDFANEIIRKNLKIKTYFVSENDLEKVPFRRNIAKVSGDLRVVEIEGMDYSACGGTHCESTSEIGLLKIIKTEKINNDTRIFYTTGKLSLDFFRKYEDIVSYLASHFHTHTENLLPSFQQIIKQNLELQKEIQSLKKQLLPIEAQNLYEKAEIINSRKVIITQDNTKNANDLRSLATVLQKMEKSVILAISENTGKLSVIVACANDSGLSAIEIFKTISEKTSMKGGGNKDLAQGGGDNSILAILAKFKQLL